MAKHNLSFVYMWFFISACGSGVSSQDFGLEIERLSDEAVSATSVDISYLYQYGGLATPYYCDDGNQGSGGAYVHIASDGRADFWTGCMRPNIKRGELDHNIPCSVSEHHSTQLDPTQWLQVKRGILESGPSSLEDEYSCKSLSAACPSDTSYFRLQVNIDASIKTIDWQSGIRKVSPERFQLLLNSLELALIHISD